MKNPEKNSRISAREAAGMAAEIKIVGPLTEQQRRLLQSSQERAARNPRALRRMGLTKPNENS